MIAKWMKQTMSMVVCSTLMIAGAPTELLQAQGAFQPAAASTPAAAPQRAADSTRWLPPSRFIRTHWLHTCTIFANPVDYHHSGIMTFSLGRDGVVYQQDLGPKAAESLTAIEQYNPTEGWTQAE
jgi:hypothetical protein